MKKYGLALLIGICVLSCSEKRKERDIKTLTPDIKNALITELQKMKAEDQLHRSYISFGTTNQKLIDSINGLSMEDHIMYIQTSHQSEFTKAQEDSLWSLQNKADLKNTNRLYEITKTYGWLSETQLDSMVNPMIFLFHTPKQTIEKMQTLLYKEVQAKRMKPNKFATYVDNMRKKAFGKNQLYGTGDEYDPKTRSVVPPFIENIDSTNMAREKIGLPKLKVGEYRTSK